MNNSGYYCLVPHPREKRLLLLSTDGTYCLPHFDHAKRGWFAHDVVEIRHSVQSLWGLDATVLRHIRDAGEEQICELEVHDVSWQPPPNSRWVDREALAEIDLQHDEHRELLEAWYSEADGQPIPPQRPPWEYKGWYAEAVDWIEAQLELLGYRLEGSIEVFKAAWSWSAILRVPTKEEELFFKAAYAKPPSEVALISALAERWPENVPCILTADFERRWMLMRNFAGNELDELPDDRWAAAAQLFATIQIDEADRVERWLDLDCPRTTKACGCQG